MSGPLAGRRTEEPEAPGTAELGLPEQGPGRPRAPRRPIRGVRHRSYLDLARLRIAAGLRSAGRGGVFRRVRHFSAFVGYARSGSTLLGGLLDAHPQAVFAHEFDALGFVSKGFGRRALFQMLIENSRDFAEVGNEWTGYSYLVPGQWQGRFADLRVLGDKKAGLTASRLRADPRLLDALRDTVRVPVKLIHVVRNPYDMLTTKILRHTRRTPAQHFDRYFYLCASVQSLKDRIDAPQMHDVRIEDVIRDPRAELRRLLAFLGLDPLEDYLAAACSIVYDASRPTRHQIDWSPERRAEVAERSQEYRFLDGYTFED